jgi:hypothetical protein
MLNEQKETKQDAEDQQNDRQTRPRQQTKQIPRPFLRFLSIPSIDQVSAARSSFLRGRLNGVLADKSRKAELKVFIGRG